jgi:hypothetical protein
MCRHGQRAKQPGQWIGNGISGKDRPSIVIGDEATSNRSVVTEGNTVTITVTGYTQPGAGASIGENGVGVGSQRAKRARSAGFDDDIGLS